MFHKLTTDCFYFDDSPWHYLDGFLLLEHFSVTMSEVLKSDESLPSHWVKWPKDLQHY